MNAIAYRVRVENGALGSVSYKGCFNTEAEAQEYADTLAARTQPFMRYRVESQMVRCIGGAA